MVNLLKCFLKEKLNFEESTLGVFFCITDKIRFSMTYETLPDVKLLQKVLIFLIFSKCVCRRVKNESHSWVTQLYISTNLSWTTLHSAYSTLQTFSHRCEVCQTVSAALRAGCTSEAKRHMGYSSDTIMPQLWESFHSKSVLLSVHYQKLNVCVMWASVSCTPAPRAVFDQLFQIHSVPFECRSACLPAARC